MKAANRFVRVIKIKQFYSTEEAKSKQVKLKSWHMLILNQKVELVAHSQRLTAYLRDVFKDKVALSVTVSCHEHVSLC